VVRQQPFLHGSDHLDLVPGEFWVVAAVVGWTSRSSVGSQLLPSVVVQSCKFVLLSISSGAQWHLLLTTATPAGAASSLEAWLWA
jgi:hypothetical protein